MQILQQFLLALAAIFVTANALDTYGYWLPGATGPVGATRTTTVIPTTTAISTTTATATTTTIPTTTAISTTTTATTTTTTTATPSTTGSGESEGETSPAFPDDLFLSIVNAYRSDHNASALTTDATMKSQAAACAQGYATAGIASGGEPTTYCADTGTGIDYFHSGGTSNLKVMQMITTWYKEACSETETYNYDEPNITSTLTQHFTQLVWKETANVGCAFSSSTNKLVEGQYITVCVFSPPGNQAPNGRNTQFIANVQKPAVGCTTTTVAPA